MIKKAQKNNSVADSKGDYRPSTTVKVITKSNHYDWVQISMLKHYIRTGYIVSLAE
ncbi:MAG: hypothetical protein WC976_06595 [Caldisericia bacterium]